MKITSTKLNNIISESVSKHLKQAMFEAQLKEKVKGIVREMFETYGGYNSFEEKDNDSDDARKADMNTEDEKSAARRSEIENYFHRPGVDCAPYAYKLFGVNPTEGEDTNEMKNARHKFMARLNHDKNEEGYPYSFSSEEVNTLENMVSSNQV